MRLGPHPDGVLDLLDGGRRVEADLIERQPPADQVSVCIVETGQHCAAIGVDHRRLRAPQALHLAVRADPHHLVAAHRDRLGELVVFARVNLAVNDDQIDGTIVFALRTDDQPGDDRDTNNESDGVCGETCGHVVFEF